MGFISTVKNVFSDSSKKKVLAINLYGTLAEDSSMSNNCFPVFNLINTLYDIADDKSYKGILLRINSPGGAAAASEELAQVLLLIKQAGIPVVTSIGDICASGAYLVASVTDKIFANKMSLVGSIGAIIQIPNFTGLAEKLGVKFITSSAGKMKDIGNPFRDMTDEEKEYFDRLTILAAKKFINIVTFHRQLKDITKMTDGRIVDASEALDNNLIDSFGTYHDAFICLCEKMNIPQERVIIEEYEVKRPLIKRILGLTSLNSLFNISLKF